MSEQPITALPRDLEALLSLEQDAYGDYQALKTEVLSHVELSVALRAPVDGGRAPAGEAPRGPGADGSEPTTSIARALAGASKAVAAGAFVTGVITGGVAMHELSPRTVAPVIATATPQDARPAPSTAPDVQTPSSSSAAPPPTAVPSALPRPTPEAPPNTSDLVREREIVDAARAALARGRPDDALTATARHARRWPRGQLAEEREVIAIQALVALDRRPEAETRAADFKHKFASSVLIPAVDAALARP